MPLFIHDVIQFIKGLRKSKLKTSTCDECGKTINGDIAKHICNEAINSISTKE